jgi:hypothetical protein
MHFGARGSPQKQSPGFTRALGRRALAVEQANEARLSFAQPKISDKAFGTLSASGLMDRPLVRTRFAAQLELSQPGREVLDLAPILMLYLSQAILEPRLPGDRPLQRASLLLDLLNTSAQRLYAQ